MSLFQSGGGSIFGGISICFTQISSFEQHDHIRNRLWSIDYGPDLDQEDLNNTESSVNLIFKSSDKDSRIWPCRYVDMRLSTFLETLSLLEEYVFCGRFELHVKVSLGPGKLTLTPSVRNVGDKPFSFTFGISNCLFVSDIR